MATIMLLSALGVLYPGLAPGRLLDTFTLGGSLTYTKGMEWPTGTRLTIDAGGAQGIHVMIFDGTDVATVSVSGDGPTTDCTVTLEPINASCML